MLGLTFNLISFDWNLHEQKAVGCKFIILSLNCGFKFLAHWLVLMRVKSYLKKLSTCPINGLWSRINWRIHLELQTFRVWICHIYVLWHHKIMLLLVNFHGFIDEWDTNTNSHDSRVIFICGYKNRNHLRLWFCLFSERISIWWIFKTTESSTALDMLKENQQVQHPCTW